MDILIIMHVRGEEQAVQIANNRKSMGMYVVARIRNSCNYFIIAQLRF